MADAACRAALLYVYLRAEGSYRPWPCTREGSLLWHTQFTDCVRIVHFERSVLLHVPTSTCTKVLALLYLPLLKVLFAPIGLRTQFRLMFAGVNLSDLTQV